MVNEGKYTIHGSFGHELQVMMFFLLILEDFLLDKDVLKKKSGSKHLTSNVILHCQHD